MKLISAIALDRPREVSTRFGQRLVIDCMARDTGEKITLWRGADDDYSRRYVIKNSPITVGVDSKGKFSLIENEALTNLGKPLPVEPVPVKPAHTYSIPPQSDPNFSPDKKAEMAEYVANLASLYQHCQDKAENIALTPDDARAIGTTLFIQTVKHFNL
ncbi:MAG: hypothetical protein IM473_16565 [Microcystis sp. M015S2]|uniref:hypothetical protein n=1 Tax=unclassified Microcystis TaxID=2643300 RepID=UPI00259100DF|nr:MULTISPECIES: hypothetical protein [unclassified Microcystis]MCA2711457.1 hypothetical protein [Microcystis sp. M025S2]MCA2743957.1 hypothetical protein [Microcystis sp. M015S2]MCA2761187.1 hypothetical protein [Microcystis sp. M145S2]